jgi:hypothetical protein
VSVEIEFGISLSFEFQNNPRMSVGFFEILHCSILSEKFLCFVDLSSMKMNQTIVNLLLMREKNQKKHKKSYRNEMNELS